MNGKHCENGLANYTTIDRRNGLEVKGSACTTVIKVMQGNKELFDPYECDPTENTLPCKLFFGTNADQFIETPCHCALDGTNRGYCASVLGTEAYKNALVPYKYMLERSDCHTLDRNNFRAQLDCNSGTKVNKLKDAVDAMFKVSHWPYMHSKQTKTLIEAVSINSWDNIQAVSAVRLLAGIGGAIVSSGVLFMSI